uniref:Uncharacterized protein n=1 Tax=Meloidogyne enterolobii TaxID=390850 RepID=A0A6V7WIT3_MELEN|nr:unnamed protein product [Meloidogyne enterolobii]
MFIKLTIIYLNLFFLLINANNEEQIKSVSADNEISTKELLPKIGGGLGLIGNGLIPQQQPFNLPSFPPQPNPFINNFYQPPPFNNYFLRSPYFIPPQTNPFYPYQNFPLFNSGIGTIPQYPLYQPQLPLGGPQLPLGGLPGDI